VIASQDFVDMTPNGSFNASTYQTGVVRFVATSTSTTIQLMDTSSSTANDMDIDRIHVYQVSPSTGAFIVNENSANGTDVGTTNAVDVDTDDSFTYALSSNAGGRFTINSTTGQITVANGGLLDSESENSHIITVVATDAGGLTKTQSIMVLLGDVNEAPTAVVDTAIAVEAGGIENGTAGTNPTGSVLTNDTDIDTGDTKTVSGVAAGTLASASGSYGIPVAGAYGSINIAANGAYTYTVDNSNAAVQALRTTANTLQDVFTYTMRDTAGLTSTTQVTVTIQGANDAPHDLAGTLTVAENSANGTSWPLCDQQFHRTSDRSRWQPARLRSREQSQHHGSRHRCVGCDV
jgi:VCBS repeat-containing protein